MTESRSKVSSLVREARDELKKGNRDEAFLLLKKALSMDLGSSEVTEVILAIEKENFQEKARESRASAILQKPSPEPARAPVERVRSSVEPVHPRVEPVRAVEVADRVVSPQRVKPSAAKLEIKPSEQVRIRTEEPAKPTQAVAPAGKPSPVAASTVKTLAPRGKTGVTLDDTPDGKPQTACKPAQPAVEKSFRHHVIPGDDPAPTPVRGVEAAAPVTERKSVPVQQNLQSFFDSADKALASGDEAGAMNLLRKAKELAPDDPDVRGRLLALQRRIKAENLVRIGQRKLEAGSASEAFAAAKEAFALMPMAPGLEELISRLEKSPSAPGSKQHAPRARPDASKTTVSPARQPTGKARGSSASSAPGKSHGDGAEEYVRKVREQIQLSALPNAAATAAEGLAKHPDNELLMTFVDKFTRMKLLK